MIDLLLLPLLAGLGVALTSGPLGSFIIWRRMAYFGDTLAHSALLGVAIGLFLSIDTSLSIIATSIFFAISLVILEKKSHLSSDTVLGILSHSALALGLICVSLYSHSRVNLQALLFGDFLTTQIYDVFTIYTASSVVLLILIIYWKRLLLIATDEDLARVEGLPVDYLRIVLMVLTAIVIAITMKIVGVLLITALLIIPAASARAVSSSPEAMAAVASGIAALSVIVGLVFSYYVDVPAGPAIVIVSAGVFFISRLLSKSK